MKVTVVLLVALFVCAITAQIIPNEYLIKFRDNTPKDVRRYHALNVTQKANGALKINGQWEIEHFSGYHASIPDGHFILSHLRQLPEVEIIEPNQHVHKAECIEQPTNKGLWGLNRISRAGILENAPYIYQANEGEGVLAYIIDTGIYLEHDDFEGRAVWGENFIDKINTDQNGHGTHVAGTIGGTQYGVAKKSTLVAVKVLDKNGSGTLGAVIDGINFVAIHSKGRRATANLSLGASFSAVVNAATEALVKSGVFAAVAAGNSNANANNYSPASAPLATCVGATSSSDIRAYFSNWGPRVDIMAPGVDILSAWIGSPSASLAISGTSMASPHVAGVATSLLSLNPHLTPLEVHNWIVSHASHPSIGDLRNSPDSLLFKGCVEDPTLSLQ
eukprot:TRINITY_DN236_c0_g1_i1.p1 TRINITY_DN236_c0_g1~~TRINITY_DN236_c0_g1_i1.p1  ORF type:complete len:390 (+),score=90.98 TRINITY_DN236_c0_g1_i1:35-1204(+)